MREISDYFRSLHLSRLLTNFSITSAGRRERQQFAIVALALVNYCGLDQAGKRTLNSIEDPLVLSVTAYRRLKAAIRCGLLQSRAVGAQAAA